MTTDKAELNIKHVMQEYLEYCYNEYPDAFLIVKDGQEMTATEWCSSFGGTPKGKSNSEFLNEQFNKGSELCSPSIEDDRYDDD